MRYIIYALAFCILVSCSSKKVEENKTYIPTPNGIEGIQKTNATIQPSDPGKEGELPLNPAHGAPGHRCDIAVGAPLKSASSSTAATPSPTPTAQTAPPVPEIKQVSPAATTVQNDSKLNPTHGAPGHRCDIAVGAPLDSKPAKN